MKLITTLSALALASVVLFAAGIAAGRAPLELFAGAATIFTVLAAFGDYSRNRPALVASAQVSARAGERLPFAA